MQFHGLRKRRVAWLKAVLCFRKLRICYFMPSAHAFMRHAWTRWMPPCLVSMRPYLNFCIRVNSTHIFVRTVRVRVTIYVHVWILVKTCAWTPWIYMVSRSRHSYTLDASAPEFSALMNIYSFFLMQTLSKDWMCTLKPIFNSKMRKKWTKKNNDSKLTEKYVLSRIGSADSGNCMMRTFHGNR